MKYTETSLKHLETVFIELGYTVRYEKGSFKASYCLLKDQKVAVLNKYFTVEGKINALLEIIKTIEVDLTLLSEKSQQFLNK